MMNTSKYDWGIICTMGRYKPCTHCTGCTVHTSHIVQTMRWPYIVEIVLWSGSYYRGCLDLKNLWESCTVAIALLGWNSGNVILVIDAVIAVVCFDEKCVATIAAFHWSREQVITSSRAVKQRSIHVVNSWTRNHERWTRVGFVHLEFTAHD